MADHAGRSTAWVVAHGEYEIDDEEVLAKIDRRLTGEPLQYVRAKTEFFGREFYVDNRVLIPRPETELVVETAIELAPRGASVIDVGTGSGCIAVTVAAARPDLRVTACDISAGALAVARRNGARALVASDVLTAFRTAFDVIIANAPYIAAAEVEQLATEVRDHEPRVALTPGPRGTEVIERILAARCALVILEIAFGQERAIRDLAKRGGYDVEAVRNDLAGIPRVVVLKR